MPSRPRPVPGAAAPDAPVVAPAVRLVDALQAAGLFDRLRTDLLEARWRAWHASRSRQPGGQPLRPDEPPCIQTCRHTTRYVLRLLAALGVQDTRPHFGWCEGPLRVGTHAWLTVGGADDATPAAGAARAPRWVLDLTAEQFGGPCVVWAPQAAVTVPPAPDDPSCYLVERQRAALPPLPPVPAGGVRYRLEEDERHARALLAGPRGTVAQWERRRTPDGTVTAEDDPARLAWLADARRLAATFVAVADPAPTMGRRASATGPSRRTG